jgi:putative FmdB family regulatory protein
MPLYEYKCDKCQAVFDSYKSQSMGCQEDPGSECPTCKASSRRVEISTTSEPVFKGKGFYATDYKGKTTYKG